MRRWRESLFVGFCLAGLPTLALSQSPPTLPQEFVSTFQAGDTAYARKDIDSILSSYAPNCTFIEVIREYHFERKDAENKSVKGTIKATRRRHDAAWQRQELQQLFFVTLQPLEKTYSLPLQTISVTSDIQKSSVNRRATELRLTVERTIFLHQGQVQSQENEDDEEIWSKGAQGWKLKSRMVNQKGRWTDYS